MLKSKLGKFHVVTWQTTSKNCAKVLALRLFFLIHPIRLLFSGVVTDVNVTVVLAYSKTVGSFLGRKERQPFF